MPRKPLVTPVAPIGNRCAGWHSDGILPHAFSIYIEGLAEYTGVFIALRETVGREAPTVEALEDSTAFARRGFARTLNFRLGLLVRPGVP